jgi:hypothetical protein
VFFFIIQDKALMDVLLEGLCRLLAKSRRFFRVHAVTDSDYGVEVVKINGARNLAAALDLNYFLFGNNCFTFEFLFVENLVKFGIGG